jgi:3,4-dihydroxy 2-butanone 4-phosphate synthase/GTP cyclohydrolase II
LTSHHRPRVTLTWAQSIDGSIASEPGARTLLSGPESMKMTHELRAKNDAILVGIGTILADDPTLSLRFAAGADPRPVVLDSTLRIPLFARILTRPEPRAWIITAPGNDAEKVAALEALGARIIEVKTDAEGGLDIEAVLAALAQAEIKNLLVEGGGGVINSFIVSRLVDEIVITIAPRILAGFNPFAGEAKSSTALHFVLEQPHVEIRGHDTVISGKPSWPS